MEININVVNQKLRLATNLREYVSGSQNFVKFVFNLDSSWNNLYPFAQFAQNDGSYNLYLDSDNSVYMPPEIEPGECRLTLYGANNGVRATTNTLILTIDENMLVVDAQSIDITPSLYEQLVSKVDQLTTVQQYESVADMKASDALKSGMYVKTSGYYNDGDGGGALYKIVDTVQASYFETLDNGLYALLIEDRDVTPEMFGARGDYVSSVAKGTDDYQALQSAINYAGPKKLRLVLSKKYYSHYTLQIGSSCRGLEIVGVRGNTEFSGIYSDVRGANGKEGVAVEQFAQLVSYKDMTISAAETTKNSMGDDIDGADRKLIGIRLLTSVDDHMTYLNNVQLRYLHAGLVMFGNSVEIINTHFSMSNYGIVVRNGGTYSEDLADLFNLGYLPYSPYEFKSLIVTGCRFHDTHRCIKIDDNIVPETNGNGLHMTNCIADKCGYIYMGTCYNLQIYGNYFQTSSRDIPTIHGEMGPTPAAMIYLTNSMSPSQSITVPNVSSIMNNEFKCGQNLGFGVIYAENCRRFVLNGNSSSGSGANLIYANEVQNIFVTNNISTNHNITIYTTISPSNICIDGNATFGSANHYINILSPTAPIFGTNVGYTVGGE